MEAELIEDGEFLALHCLTMKTMAGPDQIEAMVGVPAADARAALGRFLEAGEVKEARGNHILMTPGRDRLAGLYPVIYKAARESEALAGAYTRFERCNTELKRIVTDWQTVPVGGDRVPNDHGDADYDNKAIDRLGALHERACAVVDAFAAEIPRLARHKVRLDAAVERVFAGERDYFSGVRVDSYHTVWFEFHEDLIRILGTERVE